MSPYDRVVFEGNGIVTASTFRWSLTRISKKAFRVVEGDAWSGTLVKVIRAGPVKAQQEFVELIALRQVTRHLKK